MSKRKWKKSYRSGWVVILIASLIPSISLAQQAAPAECPECALVPGATSRDESLLDLAARHRQARQAAAPRRVQESEFVDPVIPGTTEFEDYYGDADDEGAEKKPSTGQKAKKVGGTILRGTGHGLNAVATAPVAAGYGLYKFGRGLVKGLFGGGGERRPADSNANDAEGNSLKDRALGELRADPWGQAAKTTVGAASAVGGLHLAGQVTSHTPLVGNFLSFANPFVLVGGASAVACAVDAANDDPLAFEDERSAFDRYCDTNRVVSHVMVNKTGQWGDTGGKKVGGAIRKAGSWTWKNIKKAGGWLVNLFRGDRNDEEVSEEQQLADAAYLEQELLTASIPLTLAAPAPLDPIYISIDTRKDLPLEQVTGSYPATGNANVAQ